MLKPPPDWPRALTLLDEALALRPEARADWLERTAAREPSVSPLLRKLLSAHRRVETHAILATLPRSLRNTMSVETGQTGLLIGPFELIESLGRGGMGSVWRARYADGRLKRDVAVKLPAASDDPAALAALRERFARERDFLGQLEHPNIARLYDTGVSDDGQPFLAMEYVVGKPIDEYCDEHRLPIKARLGLFLQVLDAVEYAHRHLVLHRDLKPANVLVDEHGQVRLLDFGVAKLLPPPTTLAFAAPQSTGTDLTEMAGAAITLAYAAPEQINHLLPSTPTDVYALGVMLYRLLTGLSPYEPSRDTRGSLEDAVLNQAPAAASTRRYAETLLTSRMTSEPALRKALRGDLDVILGKALKKSANERYPTVNAFAEDLRRQRTQQPITARPDSSWYRTQRFVARHRAAVTMSTLAVTALIATTSVAVWQATVATANAERAGKSATRANAAQQFFAGLFSAADPEKNQNITEFDRKMIDRALATAEAQFGSDPETLAVILKQIGDIYFRQDRNDHYLATSERRLTILNAAPSVDPAIRADAEIDLARAQLANGDPNVRKRALAQAQAAVNTAQASQTLPEFVDSLTILSEIQRAEGKTDAAIESATRAIAQSTQLPGERVRLVALAHTARGHAMRAAGRYTDSIDDLTRSLQLDPPEKSPSINHVTTLTGLSIAQHDASQYTNAVASAQKAMDHALRYFGETGDLTLTAKLYAVSASVLAGEAETAKGLADRYLAAELASGDAFRIARAQYVLSQVAVAEARYDDALRFLDSATPQLQQRPRWAAQADSYRAAVLLQRGANTADAQLASNLLTGVIDRLKKAGATDSSDFRLSSLRLVAAKARLSARAEARQYLTDACNNIKRISDPMHPDRVRCEAYRLLLTDDVTYIERLNQLVALTNSFAASRTDRMRLLSNLRLAVDWLQRADTNSNEFTQSFPFLS